MTKPTDYSDPRNWMNVLPKQDVSSDVFYLYPTAWPGDPNGALTCPVDHPGMRRGAETVFGVQASVFFPISRVFAPYYRQFNFALKMSGQERDAAVCGIPLDDAKAAFEWYFHNRNQGRPFFIFSHSQGAQIAKHLVFHVIAQQPAMFERMVAAYIIGFGVTQAELDACPQVPFARQADDTGVIISYNTEPPGYEALNPTAPPGSVAINPLSWTRDETPAPASLNPGSLMTGSGRFEIRRGFADAAVNLARGTVVCSSVDVETYGGPPPVSPFHGLDVGLYYLALRENAQIRLRQWSEEKCDGGLRPDQI